LLHLSLRTPARVFAIALGAVSLTAFLLNLMFKATRIAYCLNITCDNQTRAVLPANRDEKYSPIGQCAATTLLLARGDSGSLRDKILLVGKSTSVAEYVLPSMHFSRYDPTLSDPSYSRQGLSAVRYGYPLSIASSKLRLLLFHLGLADAIVFSPTKTTVSFNPRDVKYRFRLQPFKDRVKLPDIPPAKGISEDSEVVIQHLKKNSSLFDQPSYSCL